MLKKKIVAVVLAVTMISIAAATYAWFTDDDTADGGTVEAGELGISYELKSADTFAGIFPVEVINGEPQFNNPIDSALFVYGLVNTSSRPVFVGIDAMDGPDDDFPLPILAGPKAVAKYGVAEVGDYSIIDEDGYLVDNSAVSARLSGAELTAANSFTYTIPAVPESSPGAGDGTGAIKRTYIYLAPGQAMDIKYEVWLDGDLADDTYQGATIELDGMRAMATQFKKAAILSEFGNNVAWMAEDALTVDGSGTLNWD